MNGSYSRILDSLLSDVLHDGLLQDVNLTAFPFAVYQQEQNIVVAQHAWLTGGSRLSAGQTALFVLYALIVSVSLLGNSLTCYVVLNFRSMRSVTNVFILNLAVSDLAMTCLNIPFRVADVAVDSWPLDEHVCRTMSFIMVVSVYVSSLTILGIALDRYVLILHPLRPRMRRSSAALLLLSIWLVSILLSLPYCVFARVDTVELYYSAHRCHVVFPGPDELVRRWLMLATTVTQYVLPLSVTTFAYLRIVCRLNSSEAVIGHTTDEQRLRQARNRRKTVRMLIVVVATFALCWLPLNLYHAVSNFGLLQPFHPRSALFLLCHGLAMSSVVYNPFIYCLLHNTFRLNVRRLLRRLPCCRRDTPAERMATQRRPRDVRSRSSWLSLRVPRKKACTPDTHSSPVRLAPIDGETARRDRLV